MTLYNKFGEVNTKFGLIATELLTKQDKDGDKQLTKDDFISNATYASLRAQTTTKSDVGLGNVQNYGVATDGEAEAGTATNRKITPLRNNQHFLTCFMHGIDDPTAQQGRQGSIYFKHGDDNVFVNDGIAWRQVFNVFKNSKGVWLPETKPYINVSGEWKKITVVDQPYSNIMYGRVMRWETVDWGKTFVSGGMDVPTQSDYETLRSYGISVMGGSNSTVALHFMHRRTRTNPVVDPKWITGYTHPYWNVHDGNNGNIHKDTFRFGAFGAGNTSWSSGNHFNTGNTGVFATKTLNGSRPIIMNFFRGSGNFSIQNGNVDDFVSIKFVRLATQSEQSFVDGTIVAKVLDYEDNVYDCVKIGTQVWTVQCFAAAYYMDGTALENPNSSWAGYYPDFVFFVNDSSDSFEYPSIWKDYKIGEKPE